MFGNFDLDLYQSMIWHKAEFSPEFCEAFNWLLCVEGNHGMVLSDDLSLGFSSWDEWVPESRVLKYVDTNLQKQKELQKANQWVVWKKCLSGNICSTELQSGYLIIRGN